MKTTNQLTGFLAKIVLIALFFILAFAGKIFGKDVKDPIITGSISTGIFSHYVAPMGYVIGKGPHNQNYIDFNMAGFKLFGWSDYDFGARDMNELDWGLSYSKKIKNTFLKTGFTYWYYPLGNNLSDDDEIVYISLEQGKKIGKKISLIHLMKDHNNGGGYCLNAILSKKFEYNNFSYDLGISSAYVWDFYGDTGFAHITPGTNIVWKIGIVDLAFSLNYQWGFISQPAVLPSIKDQFYGSVNLSVNF